MAGSSPAPQRAWRAACPNCGAPVDFRSSASASAVCSFCRSTLVRDGETLRRVGRSAELFDDHSPLQLGANGQLQGVAFTLIGRLQIGYADGTWNEWHALFDNGRSGWLSEDNGAYVLGFETDLPGPAPAASALAPGARVPLGGSDWDVASVVRARLLAAEGELPRSPRVDTREFVVADLRNALGEVATLDYGEPGPPQFSIGRSVTLAGLRLQGLRDRSEKTLGARSLNCPQCGAGVEVRLASTQSLSCPQCRALIDVSGGVGSMAAGVRQAPQPPAGHAPRIPAGSPGRLALADGEAVDWQVLGYLVRADVPEDDESPTPWSEYLLYNRTLGFAFLVDTAEGWSVVRPLTGAPEVRGRRASWQGRTYGERYTYAARVLWVEGEFYWRVQRDEQALVTDYAGEGAARERLMSREQTRDEVTWSEGRQLDAAEVARAFGLDALAAAAPRADVRPLGSGSGGLSLKRVLILFAILVLVMLVLSRCSRDDCDEVALAFGAASNEYRQCLQARSSGGRLGGGSFGGFSSGGGHK